MSCELLLRIVLVVLALILRQNVLAAGESTNGFPNWEERVLLEWTNRARSDPQIEMSACGTKCPDAACYTAIVPFVENLKLNRAARFHAAEQKLQGFASHTSACTVVSNIDALFPDSCDGSATCACAGGVKQCSPTCTTFSSRAALFGTSVSGEDLAYGFADPDAAFNAWMREQGTNAACTFSTDKGERWNLLKGSGAAGAGFYADYSAIEFGAGSAPTHIPSAAHYPRQASSVDVWANWYSGAGPSTAVVNVDGVCRPLALARGSSTNGAWTATLTNVASGCHRYYFEFRDAGNTPETYPTSGSLGIGPAGSCADWDVARPPSCGLPTLDIDASINSTRYDALTDGVLAIRYMFGLTGATLTSGALGAQATITDPAAIKAHLDAIRPMLDIDGDGRVDTLTDGLLILRYLFGLRGSALIQGALVPTAPRNTAPLIEDYIRTVLVP